MSTFKVIDTSALRLLDNTGKTKIALSWNAAVPEVPDIEEFSVYRCNAEEGTYLEIADEIELDNYTDTDATLDLGLEYFYKVLAKSTTQGTSTLDDADIVSMYSYKDDGLHESMYYMMVETVRRLNWSLDHFGEKCNIYLRKRAGNRCSSCWDVESKKAADYSCAECYGTGFTGGYVKMEDQRVLIEGATENLIEGQFGVTVKHNPKGWISNLPMLSEHDILVRATNERCYITEVSPKKLQNYVIQQYISLEVQNPDNPIYQIP